MIDASEFVVPSEIPWAEMTGEALEELLYWLCDALGARDLEWRAGSSSGTSTDGCRDLEATFSLPLPDGELRPERWWLQAKGRTSTVERSAVQQAVLDASADPEIATLAAGDPAIMAWQATPTPAPVIERGVSGVAVIAGRVWVHSGRSAPD